MGAWYITRRDGTGNELRWNRKQGAMELGTRRDGTGNKVAAMLMGMKLTLITVELGGQRRRGV